MTVPHPPINVQEDTHLTFALQVHCNQRKTCLRVFGTMNFWGKRQSPPPPTGDSAGGGGLFKGGGTVQGAGAKKMVCIALKIL